MRPIHQDRQAYLSAWAASLVLHGTLIGLVALSTILGSTPPQLKVFQWEVMLVSTAVEKSELSSMNLPISDQVTSPPKPPSPQNQPTVTPVNPTHAPEHPTHEMVSPTEHHDDSLLELDETTPESPQIPAESQTLTSANIDPNSSETDTSKLEVSNAEVTTTSLALDPDWLAEELWRKLEAYKRYPALARRNGWEGEVVIRTTIRGDGQLVQAEVEKSSGYQVLDHDALQLVFTATPIKIKRPQSFGLITISIPINYRLQR